MNISDKPTLISEMLKFHFAGKIVCSDGEEGILTHVGFDPTSRRVTHLGVKLGRFLGKTVFVPFTAVVAATRNAVSLTLTRAELAASSNVSPSGALLDARSVVQNSETNARGSLKLVAVQPKSGDLAYLVVHHLRSGQDTLLQADTVARLDTGNITVLLPEATLQTLPAYRSDEELQREAESILFDLAPLHIDFPGMTTTVLDGVLYLDGNISSSLRSDIVEDQTMGLQGLLEVKNHLVGDDSLASDLAMVLGHNPQTRDLPIGVYPRLGAVRLSGAVHSAEQKSIAEEIARNYPGVRSVFNDLVIDPKTDLLHVMSSSAGGETGDKIPGKYIRHTK